MILYFQMIFFSKSRPWIYFSPDVLIKYILIKKECNQLTDRSVVLKKPDSIQLRGRVILLTTLSFSGQTRFHLVIDHYK